MDYATIAASCKIPLVILLLLLLRMRHTKTSKTVRKATRIMKRVAIGRASVHLYLAAYVTESAPRVCWGLVWHSVYGGNAPDRSRVLGFPDAREWSARHSYT